MLLYVKGKEEYMASEKQKSHINKLLKDKDNLTKISVDLRVEVTLLNSKLEGMTKSTRMHNYGSNTFDEILGVGKIAKDRGGVGFDYNEMNEKENKFVPPERKNEF